MNEFIMLQEEQTDHLRRNSPFGYPLENDCLLNDLNRRIIEALKKSTGTVFIGSFNYHSLDPEKILKEYTGQFIYNFGCDFCIPVFDEPLANLITEWNQTNKIKTLNEIFNRIKLLGGVIFTWA